MQKMSYRVFFLSFQIQSNRYVPIGNKNATNRWYPFYSKSKEVSSWGYLNSFLKSTQIPPSIIQILFTPHGLCLGSLNLKEIPRVWQLSLWPLQVVVFGPRLVLSGFWGGEAGWNSPLVVELKPTKKRVAIFCNEKAGWLGGFPLPGCNRDWLIFHFFFGPGKGFALKRFFDYFCDRATQQAPYFCDLWRAGQGCNRANFSKWANKNCRVWRSGGTICQHVVKVQVFQSYGRASCRYIWIKVQPWNATPQPGCQSRHLSRVNWWTIFRIGNPDLNKPSKMWLESWGPGGIDLS